MLIPSAPFSQSSTESWQSYFLNSTRVHPPLHFPHQHHLSLDHSTRLLPGLPSPFSVCSSSFSTWQPDQIFHLHLWFKWLSITLRKMPQTLLARPSRPHMVWSHMSSPVCTQPRHVTFLPYSLCSGCTGQACELPGPGTRQVFRKRLVE